MEIQKADLGKTGLKTSEIGFGSWAVGSKGYGFVDEKLATRTVEAYIDSGGNFIDTAPAYGGSEALLGKIIKSIGQREKIVLATKTKMGDSPDTVSKIKTACEESLRLLQTDYIDIYYLHTPPEDMETIKLALDEFDILKEHGKIRAIGASIKGAAVTQATVDLTKTYIETGRIDVLQLAYSIIRQANAEVFKQAYNSGIGIVTRTSIESGFLSGKYKSGHIFSTDHRLRWPKETLEKIFKLSEEITKYAVRPPYKNLTQVAIRFSLAPNEVASLLVGAKSPEQLYENLNALSLPPLAPELIDRIQKEFSEMTEQFNPAQQGWAH
jgi:myo-inositol catabolism protein IolS